MSMGVSFPFPCSCGRAGISIIPEPVLLDAAYLAPDCRDCGNTIVIIPTLKLSDAVYEYSVRVCKTEREDSHTTPIR